LKMNGEEKFLVMDSGGFIKGFHHLDSYSTKYQLYTLPEVIDEIRDQRTREKLETMTFRLNQSRRPHPDALARVIQFCKLTGDFPFLSGVDIQVLALAITLEIEKNGTKYLRESPSINRVPMQQHPTASQVDTKKSPEQSQSGEEKSETEGKSENQTPSESSEISESVSESLEKEIPVQESGSPEEKIEKTSFATEQTLVVNNFDEEEYDEESDEEGWITEDNFEQVVLNSTPSETVVEDGRIFVGCCTTDFAMQNVLLQMGGQLLSVDGFQIRNVTTWVLQCHICYKVCSTRDKVFCPSCGNKSLRKISMFIDAKGQVNYRYPNRPLTTRGTKFALPKPKTGRCNQPNGTGPVISEFQWERISKTSVSAKKTNVFDLDGFSEKKQVPLSSRRGNPNQVRRTTNKNKRNRRRK